MWLVRSTDADKTVIIHLDRRAMIRQSRDILSARYENEQAEKIVNINMNVQQQIKMKKKRNNKLPSTS